MPWNRKRYPVNWTSEIRPQVLARAGNCCEGSDATGAFSMSLIVTIMPLHTMSEANASQREHWGSKHRRHKGQRAVTYFTLRDVLGCVSPVQAPMTITLTRIAPRALDEGDNLAASLKACRDGVADYLCGHYGQGQDRQPGLHWRYAQRQGYAPRVYGVEIVVNETRTWTAGDT